MQLNPIMEAFYVSILDYAGLKLQDNIIVQKNEKLGDFTIDDKFIALPYMELLKNPQGKLFFHLLNENYTSPETTLFNQFKNRLTLELNLRLTTLITSLIAVASDPMLQQRIRSGVLINVISEIGETDHSVIEGFLSMVKASTKQNKEGYLVDIFLKKNGTVKDVPFAAIGKLNFHLHNEVKKALESPEKDYRVYGTKVRKKDLTTVYNVQRAIFPDIENPEVYTEGTDNKTFRYLNILLKTSYILSSRMNELADLLEEINEPTLNVQDIRGNHDWVDPLQELQGMAAEIRLIPNQTDASVEAKRLVLDESKAVAAPAAPVTQPPSFNPAMVQQTQVQQPMQQSTQMQQPMRQPQQLSPEEIIRQRAAGISQPQQMNPMMNPAMMGMMNPAMMQNPTMMQQMMAMQPNMGQPQMTPTWLQMEMLKAQAQQQVPGQPMVNNNDALAMQQMLQLQQQQQQLQQMQQQAMMQNGMMMPQMQPQQQGIALNPMFMQPVGLRV